MLVTNILLIIVIINLCELLAQSKTQEYIHYFANIMMFIIMYGFCWLVELFFN